MKFGSVLKLAAALLVVVVVAMIAASKALDSGRYQAFLAERVRAASGLELSFSGPTKLKLGLKPVLSFTGLALAAPKSAQPLIYVDRIEARIALLPLLLRRLELEDAVLIRPLVRLASALPVPAALDLSGGGDRVPPTRLALGVLRVEDGVLMLPSGSTIAIRRGRVLPDAVAGGPLTYQADGTWNAIPYELAGVAGSVAQLTGGKPFPVQAKGSLGGAGIVAKGQLANPREAKGLEVEVWAQGDELADVLKLVGFAPGGMVPAAIGPFKAQGKVVEAGGVVGLGDLDAVLGKRDGMLLAVKGAVRDLGAMTGLDLLVSGEAEGLGVLGRLMGIEPPAIGPVKLSAHLNDIEGGWRLTGLKSSLGRSDFAGELAVIHSPRPRLFGRLASALLYPADFIAPASGAKASDHGRAVPQRPAIPVIDDRLLSADAVALDGLRALDLDLSLVAAKLVAGPVTLSDAGAEIRLSAGRLTVDAAQARLGGGRLGGDLRIDTAAKVPVMALRLTGDAIGLDHLDGEAGGAWLGGRADLALEIRTSGANPRALGGNLDGWVWVQASDVAVGRAGLSDLGARLLTQLDAGAKDDPVRLRCAALRGTIKGGMAQLDKGLAAETATGQITGGGSLDLRTEALDLAFTARPSSAWGRLRGTLAQPVLVTDGAAPRPGSDIACRAIAKPNRR
jgi:uncharacterized protein involved in outer membrane biogenesis